MDPEIVEQLVVQCQLLWADEPAHKDLIVRAAVLLGRLATAIAETDPGLAEAELVKDNGIALAAIGLFLGQMGSTLEGWSYGGRE
jgi:hypothetical protein